MEKFVDFMTKATLGLVTVLSVLITLLLFTMPIVCVYLVFTSPRELVLVDAAISTVVLLACIQWTVLMRPKGK